MKDNNVQKKKDLWPLLFGILLFCFTLYLVLDTFVIRRTYLTDVSQMNTGLFEDTQTSADRNGRRSKDGREPIDLSEPLTYQDDHINITVTEYLEYDTHIYVADVVISSAEYLKTAFAEDTFGSNITAPTSEIAAQHNAILAVNGDYYGSQEKGYVIRNGVVYRDRGNGKYIACIYADGTLDIVHCEEYDADELVEMGVWQEFCFGPGLILDNEILVEADDEVRKAKTSNPRTAIGMIEPNHFLVVVSDGRSDESVGLTLLELAEFMHSLGAVTAYNLDGGGSSTMVFEGTVINNPSSGRSFDERSVSDIVYIG